MASACASPPTARVRKSINHAAVALIIGNEPFTIAALFG